MSLLSTDYKIVVKAILLRLGSVLADVIYPDQTYTIPDRNQEKAFDRVDHGYLLSTLRVFGFGLQFVGFLQVLYAAAEYLVKLNWTLTEPVSFGRGVRQGFLLSGQLYTLAIEPFLCILRRRLTGLVLREPELRLVLSAYATQATWRVEGGGLPGHLFGSLLSLGQPGQELWLGGSDSGEELEMKPTAVDRL
ncbi:unnamed protein product [Caretta caretta]